MPRAKIMTKTHHLVELSLIIKDFIDGYKFNRNYLQISGTVQYNIHSYMEIICQNEFEDMTIKQVREICWDLNERLRKYLSDNRIYFPLIVRTVRNNVELVFELKVQI